MYGDPDALDKLAAGLKKHATEVREHADEHQRLGQAARWVSTAAQAYRDKVTQDKAAAYQVADRIDAAAAALRAHAQEIRETLAVIARFERAATEWFNETAHKVANTFEDVVDTATGAVKRLFSDPPWKTWPIGPASLPGPGDKQWLDVGAFLQKKGVL